MQDSVTQGVIEIIAQQAVLTPQDLTPDMSIAELGLDSLALVEAIFALEEKFKISIPFNANAPTESDFDLSSISSIIRAVDDLIAKQK